MADDSRSDEESVISCLLFPQPAKIYKCSLQMQASISVDVIMEGVCTSLLLELQTADAQA